jgi:hypothetical protein
MSYPDAAWDRVMTVQDTLMKGISGEWHWFRVATVLVVALIGTMLLGVYPRPLFDFAEASARSLGVVGLAATQIK